MKIELKYILYVLFFIIGIILFILINNKNNFQVGGILRVFDKNLNIVCNDDGTELKEYYYENEAIRDSIKYKNFMLLRDKEKPSNRIKFILGILNSDEISQSKYNTYADDFTIPAIDDINLYKGKTYYDLFYNTQIYQLFKYYIHFLNINKKELIHHIHMSMIGRSMI